MKNKKKKRIKKEVQKVILFLLIFSIFFSAFLIYKKIDKEKKIELEKETYQKKQKKLSQQKCSLKDFWIKEEKRKIQEKKEAERLAKLVYKKRVREAEKSPNRTIIISTSARGKSAFGYAYIFGDGFMFKKIKIASGRKNYETPVGKFNLKYKKEKNMSNVYPNHNGVNNMNYMLAITNNGIALHEGSAEQPSHGCVHIPKKYALWLFNWVDKNTKIYITNKKNIDYKHKSLSQLISEINTFNKIEKKKNSIKIEKITYWKNGNKKEHWTYLGGRLEGKQYIYYENGQIKTVWNYYHDRKNGVQLEYWPNGIKKSFTLLIGGRVWEKMTWFPTGEMNTYYKKPAKNN